MYDIHGSAIRDDPVLRMKAGKATEEGGKLLCDSGNCFVWEAPNFR
jgi:hypothetical protein